MLKNAIKKRLIITFMTLIILLIIFIVPVNKEFEHNISINNNFNNIYLLNNSDFLVRVSIISNSNEEIEKIKEVIESLTINGKISNYINTDMKAIIPENTKVLDLSLDDKLLKINFSKELLNVNKNNEEKLIESLIYSLTEFESVDSIMIFVEGNILTKLPNSNKNIPILLNRDFGINKIYDLTTINNTSQTTVYYFINNDNKYNAVPVTIFSNTSEEKVEIIINKLKSSSIYQTNLVSFLNNNIKLLDYEIEENKVKLNFNQYLLDTFYDDSLIEEVKYAINNSIKDTLKVSNIEILINGKKI